MPLICCLLSCVFAGSMVGRWIGQRGSCLLSVLCVGVAFAASVLIWFEVVLYQCEVSLNLWGAWIEVGSLLVQWNLRVDLMTAHMLFTVTSVSFAVHVYSVSYMRTSEDPHLNLFMSYLSLFTFFMLVLVTADNLLLMLVGWEGIGVCSYLLIGYYGHRLSAVKSAQKAILVNRISDGLLMWGVVAVWHHMGGLQYDLLLLCESDYSSRLLGFAIMIGAMGKSAQILFHVWLADAMEGPTPVSALIHAATLVTAGVYVMIRLGPFWHDVVLYVGALTALMAGVFGYFQNDLKRVIAFSTCSQLGYMMVGVALGELGTEASMCHLMTHASFKAALFLAAGVVIQACASNQHMARYGSLSSSHVSVLTLLTLLIASLSLVGWPEFSGFYSKETILNLAVVSFHPASDFAHNLLLLTALLTSIYTGKLWFNCFVADFGGSLSIGSKKTHLRSSPSFTSLLPSIAMSVLLIDIVFKVWVGTNLLSGIVMFINWNVKTLPFGLVLAGFMCAAATVASQNFALIRFGGTRWGFDQMYARTLVNLLLDWGRITWTTGDRGVFSVGELRAHA